MKTYAKLEDGALRLMERVPNISNATEQQRAEYAAAHGFKELRRTEQPGRYCAQGWHETAKLITETWTPWELDAAKEDALRELQGRRDAAMNGVVIPCKGLPNGILYNTEAQTMAQGLMLTAMQGGDITEEAWTDAADVEHAMSAELLAHIAAAMREHIRTTQAKYKPARDAVNAAQDVDEVEAALELAETLAQN